MQCIHRAPQTAPWSDYIRWFFMCKWEGLSFFKLLHYPPFCWKTNTGKQAALRQLQKGGQCHGQDGQLQSEGLSAPAWLWFPKESSNSGGDARFPKIASWEISVNRRTQGCAMLSRIRGWEIQLDLVQITLNDWFSSYLSEICLRRNFPCITHR